MKIAKSKICFRFRIDVELVLPLPRDLGAQGRRRVPEKAASAAAGPEVQQVGDAQKEIEFQWTLVSEKTAKDATKKVPIKKIQDLDSKMDVIKIYKRSLGSRRD